MMNRYSPIQRFSSKRFSFRDAVRTLLLGLLGVVLGLGLHRLPSVAQLPLPDSIGDPLPGLFKSGSVSDDINTGWVKLDGRRIFRVAAQQDDLPQRIQDIQSNLTTVNRLYRQSDSRSLVVDIRGNSDLPTLYVNDRYVMTVTHLDAQMDLATPIDHAQRLEEVIAQAIQDSYQEYQPDALLQQTKGAIALFLGTTVLSLTTFVLHRRWRKRLQLPSAYFSAPDASPVTSKITQQRHTHMRALQALFFQVSQIGFWFAGSLLILRQFPHTRFLQVWVVETLPSYLFLGVTALGTYILVRLSFIIIDWFIGTLVEGGLLTSDRDQRVQQRISTMSRVIKGVTLLLLVLIGIFVALISVGVDIAPLVAGAGLVGVAISLASQNIIRDAINGFLILVEDQYAVGDVIEVGPVFGFVENMTLRITQLRDPEERLITIPNSEIKIVSNLSSRHSQADVRIPVAYGVDIDRAIAIVKEIGHAMANDPDWADRLLSEPLTLGLDEFAERGMVIRVWIRTHPLEQWNVAREYRRRIKVAFDQAQIPLMMARQEVWSHQVPAAPTHHTAASGEPKAEQIDGQTGGQANEQPFDAPVAGQTDEPVDEQSENPLLPPNGSAVHSSNIHGF